MSQTRWRFFERLWWHLMADWHRGSMYSAMAQGYDPSGHLKRWKRYEALLRGERP
jgi:hypothetical protein